jgi:hypothetical protein
LDITASGMWPNISLKKPNDSLLLVLSTLIQWLSVEKVIKKGFPRVSSSCCNSVSMLVLLVDVSTFCFLICTFVPRDSSLSWSFCTSGARFLFTLDLTSSFFVSSFSSSLHKSMTSVSSCSGGL